MFKSNTWAIQISLKKRKGDCTTSFLVKIKTEGAIPTPYTLKRISRECKQFSDPPKDLLVCNKCICKEQCAYHILHAKHRKTSFTFSPAGMVLTVSKIIVKPIKTNNVYGKSQRTTHKIK